MKFSMFGRVALALLASAALGLGMTACGGGTIGYIWVVGQQYNQIGGFKVDDYTGNLTAIPRSPFADPGTVPVSLVLNPGGRYMYVLNQGAATTPIVSGTGFVQDGASGIVQYAVGGDGTLTYQQTFHTAGFVPVWMQLDSTGQFLYVLDKYSPSYQPNSALSTFDVNGSITAFSIDSTTGKLSLVTNATIKNGNGTYTGFFEVGQNPIQMKTIGSCLFTVNSYDQSISPYSVGSNNGQLTFSSTQKFPITGASNITSINGNGSYVILTDSIGNKIFDYGVTSGGCTLNAVTGSPYAGLATAGGPVYSILDNSGKYLYVLNNGGVSTTPGTPFSSLSGFTINGANGQLTAVAPTGNSDFTTGSGPVCMVEDTSSQYIYVSNHNDGSLTGKTIDSTTGSLSPLKRGSTFSTVGNPGCLVLSGSVS